MSEPTTDRRSILAAAIAALFGFGRAQNEPVKEVWESSVTTSKDVDWDAVLVSYSRVEIEAGGTILINDAITYDDVGRGVTWREGCGTPVIGVAQEKASFGDRFLVLIPNYVLFSPQTQSLPVPVSIPTA